MQKRSHLSWLLSHSHGRPVFSLGSNHGNKQPLQAASMTTFALPWVPSAMIGQTLRILQKSCWSSNAKTNLNFATSGFWTVGSALLACSQKTHNSQKKSQILHRCNFSYQFRSTCRKSFFEPRYMLAFFEAWYIEMSQSLVCKGRHGLEAWRQRFVLGPACGGGHLDTNKAGTSAPAAQ